MIDIYKWECPECNQTWSWYTPYCDCGFRISEEYFKKQVSHFDLAPDTASPGRSSKSSDSTINGHLSYFTKFHANQRSVVALRSQGTNWLRRDAR